MPSSAPAARFTQLIAALAYFTLYLIWLCFSLENELLHWATLVLLPILLMLACAEPAKRSLVQLLSSCGLSWDRIHKGYVPAAALGIGLCLLQLLISNHAAELRILLSQRQGLWLLLPAFALMVFTAGFTEEFFFRGYMQTRLANAIRKPWPAVLAASMLFALYHVPYAYLNQAGQVTGTSSQPSR